MEGYVLIPEAAAELGLTRWAIWRYVKTGDLPSEMLGRDRVIKTEDWEAFKAKRQANPSRGGRPPKSSKPPAP
jgi:predicted DNA-binding transcriptional regulator AlpA